MFRRFFKVIGEKFEECNDNYGAGIAVIIVILATILGFGLILGVWCLIAWALMSVYNAIAWELNWPQFGFWAWVGVVFLITWVRNLFSKRD